MTAIYANNGAGGSYGYIEQTEQQTLLSLPITNWQSFTPSGTWTSNTTYSGQWRRILDTLEVRMRIDLTGAPNAVNLTLNLPSGITIDTTKLPGSGTKYDMLGYVHMEMNGATTSYGGLVTYQHGGSTSIVLPRTTIPNNRIAFNPITQTTPATWANTDWLNINYSVPAVFNL